MPRAGKAPWDQVRSIRHRPAKWCPFTVDVVILCSGVRLPRGSDPLTSLAESRVMTIRHILILSDLSPESLRPTAPITELAAELGARVTLLSVVQDVRIAPHGAPLAPKISSPDVDREVKHAELALDEQSASLSGVDAKTAVVRGDSVPDSVVDYAQNNEVDLIALSTHGRTGFRHLALGSVAEAIIRHATVPVVTYPRAKKKH
jgi:nucleotide-binding universal stress UspA family protein